MPFGFSLQMPARSRIDQFLAREQNLVFSYEGVSLTCEAQAPAGFDHDRNRVRLGEGRAVYEAGCAALRRWAMFPQPWTRIYPAEAPIEAGRTVAVLIKTYGFWWLNAARIVYTIDESPAAPGPPGRFGFAYGTLPGHAECGEERFMIEWMADDSVWYDLQAFSRPRHPLARLAYPLARREQRRFVRESQAAMAGAVK